MKPVDKDELYQHLTQFLQSKGIELKQGSYTNRIQKGCTLLADSINLSQNGIKRAKVEIKKNLERVRQVIHEKTAPPSGSGAAAQDTPPVMPRAAAQPVKPRKRRKNASRKNRR